MSSIANMNRASYNRPNIHIGQRPKSRFAATDKQRNQLRSIASRIEKALHATSATTLNYELSQSYRDLYLMLKERNS